MANYIQKGSGNPVSGSGTVHETFTDAAKQVPGPHPDNYYDRASNPSANSLVKTPNSVYINTAGGDFGFFFGSSASFAAVSDKSLAANYTNFGALTLGTRLDIHPTAWSGSTNNSVTFIYKGGLDGSGRP